MEQQPIFGGEILRIGDVAYEDRISEMPGALLLHMLSFLETRRVVATSVLSKRWRSLWKMSLDLSFGVKCDALECAVLIGIAFTRNVRKLVLNIRHRKEGSVRFPSVLFSCDSTLQILKLKGHILLDFPSRVCLKSLRELHFNFVKFKDEASVCNLLCGCPSLQDLFVRRSSQIAHIDVATFTIAMPSLQRLTLEDDCLGEGHGGYLINTPSLKYLNIKLYMGFEFCLIENVPKLVEAKLINVLSIINEKTLVALTSAKRLTLYSSPLEIKYTIGNINIFYQLVYLELHTEKTKWWNLLSLMLNSSPKLQTLKLIYTHWQFIGDCPVGWEWDQPKSVPECFLFHLETFMWTGYKWQQEDEKQVAMYILKNARRLKKATFSTRRPDTQKDLEKLEKRREMMLNELANVVKASNSCHLVFESE